MITSSSEIPQTVAVGDPDRVTMSSIITENFMTGCLALPQAYSIRAELVSVAKTEAVLLSIERGKQRSKRALGVQLKTAVCPRVLFSGLNVKNHTVRAQHDILVAKSSP